MASDPKWCQPLSVWKKYFSEWTATPTADALTKALAFFDFRAIYGENALAEELRTYVIGIAKEQKAFLANLSNMVIKNAPPIGIFRSFVVETDSAHKNELDIKVKGIVPIVDIIRYFALENGVRETSTLERIAALREMNSIVQEYADELEHAFELIMLLRIHHQYSQSSEGVAPDNFIDPNMLSSLEKRSLKAAFQLIKKVQDRILGRLNPTIW